MNDDKLRQIAKNRKAAPGKAPSPWRWLNFSTAPRGKNLSTWRPSAVNVPAWKRTCGHCCRRCQKWTPKRRRVASSKTRFRKGFPGTRSLGKLAPGMGRVLLAQDEGLNRKIAVKVLSARLRQETSIRTRFMEEARALAQISHPSIVTIYSLGSSEEIPHFVMEYVDGVDLFTATRALTIEQRAGLMRKVVMAVDVLHQHHIIHRDLKPANILVGADLQPKLLDFGLARHVQSRDHLTLFGEMLGTPSYFSPEQTTFARELDARSDIFSLGTILYEVLTG